MLRVTLESVLGVSIERGNTLVVRAAIPPSWPGFRLRLRPLGRTALYDIEVRNTSSDASEVVGVTLDGRTSPPEGGVARVPLVDDGLDHRLEIVLR
jgi:cyclic beta-1,2-glucan synthetase